MRTARMRFASPDARGHCEFVIVEPGMVMTILDVSLSQGLVAQLHGEGRIELTYRLSGSMSLEGNWGELRCEPGTLLVWCQPVGCQDVTEEFGEKREREISVTIHLDREWLTMLQLANDRDLDHVAPDRLKPSEGPFHRLTDIRPETETLLRAILECSDEGSTRLLSLKARAYELLAQSIRSGFVRVATPKRHRSRRDNDRIDNALAILNAEYLNPPTAADLASRAGLNLAKLRRSLRERHNQTINGVVRERRLLEAHRLLSQTDLQISQIATLVGYGHHSSFSSAFVQRFGVSPRSLSRGCPEPAHER